MDRKTKEAILNAQISRFGLGFSGVSKQRFPAIDGIEQKVVLVANKTGTYHNIYFEEGKENEIYGNVADRLLDDYPDTFKVIKVNGILVQEGLIESKDNEIIQKVLSKIQKEYDLVPKKADNKEIARNKHSKPIEKDDNDYTKDKLKPKKVL